MTYFHLELHGKRVPQEGWSAWGKKDISHKEKLEEGSHYPRKDSGEMSGQCGERLPCLLTITQPTYRLKNFTWMKFKRIFEA